MTTEPQPEGTINRRRRTRYRRARRLHAGRLGVLIGGSTGIVLAGAVTVTLLLAPQPDRAVPVAGPPIAATELTVAYRLAATRRPWSYGWPLRPFDRQHPVRSFFGDPRIERRTRAFHFGIDIAAPDGTPVYAIEGGTVYRENPTAVAVVARGGKHTFGYWHIRPSVRAGQFVQRHARLGTIDLGRGHVHLAERAGQTYVNPLRPYGIGPYADRTAPTVDAITQSGTALTAVVHDTVDPPVPGAWRGKPVTPALVRWRVVSRTSVPDWRTAADFRTALPLRTRYTRVYSHATRQNRKSDRGVFSIILARIWSEPRDAGRRTLQVAVSDTAGNVGVASVRLDRAGL